MATKPVCIKHNEPLTEVWAGEHLCLTCYEDYMKPESMGIEEQQEWDYHFDKLREEAQEKAIFYTKVLN